MTKRRSRFSGCREQDRAFLLATVALPLVVYLALDGLLSAHAFQITTASTLIRTSASALSHTTKYPIGDIGSSSHSSPTSLYSTSQSTSSSTVSLPRDVKDAVSRCRQATQVALQNRMSRMEIEFPVGTKFGVEKKQQTSKSKKKGGRLSALSDNNDDDSTGSAGTPTQAMLDQSNRELARLFVEMFQPVGGNNIAVVFVDSDLATQAQNVWKHDAIASTATVTAMNRRKPITKSKTKKPKMKTKGFASKLNEATTAAPSSSAMSGGPFKLADNIEVALFVAPGEKELPVIEQVSKDVGMKTLIVILNGRLSRIPKASDVLSDPFEPVFCLGSAPRQDMTPNCLMYRAYPDDWVLARKPKVGQPKPILTQSIRPTPEECAAAYDNVEVSAMEQNVEGIVENVASWFR